MASKQFNAKQLTYIPHTEKKIYKYTQSRYKCNALHIEKYVPFKYLSKYPTFYKILSPNFLLKLFQKPFFLTKSLFFYKVQSPVYYIFYCTVKCDIFLYYPMLYNILLCPWITICNHFNARLLREWPIFSSKGRIHCSLIQKHFQLEGFYWLEKILGTLWNYAEKSIGLLLALQCCPRIMCC